MQMDAMKPITLPQGAHASQAGGDEGTVESLVRELVRQKPQSRDEKKHKDSEAVALPIWHAPPMPAALRNVMQGSIKASAKLEHQAGAGTAGKAADAGRSQEAQTVPDGLARGDVLRAVRARAASVRQQGQLPAQAASHTASDTAPHTASHKASHKAAPRIEAGMVTGSAAGAASEAALIQAPDMKHKVAAVADSVSPAAAPGASTQAESAHRPAKDATGEEAMASLQSLPNQLKQAPLQQASQPAPAQPSTRAALMKMAASAKVGDDSPASPAVAGTQDGMTYRFRSWGNEHSVTVQGQADGSMLLQPSNTLVAHRLDQQWQSGNPQQWNLARENGHQGGQQQQHQQHDAEDEA